MATELKEILEKLNRDWEEYKSTNEERLKQIEEKGYADPLIEEKLTKMDEALNSYESKFEALQKELDEARTAMKRSPIGAGDDDEKELRKAAKQFFKTKAALQGKEFSAEQVNVDEYKEYKEAFNRYLRKDTTAMTPEEQKALSVGSDPDGGYTVTPQMSARIIEYMYESSPLRELATVETISTSSLELIVDMDNFDAGWVGEQDSRPDTNTGTLKKLEIVAHEIYAQPPVTQKMLDDSSWDVEAWINRKIGRKFGRVEATGFITGDGVQKPRGILTYPNGTNWGQIEQIASGDANTLTADGLIDLETALEEEFRGNATFLLNRTAIGVVRKLKDSNGQYLWQPGLANAVPATLLGYSYRTAADMPAVAANALAVAFGDFREGYTVVERVGIRMLRDPYTSKPYVKFYATRRVGGAVVNFQAIKLQVVSA